MRFVLGAEVSRYGHLSCMTTRQLQAQQRVRHGWAPTDCSYLADIFPQRVTPWSWTLRRGLGLPELAPPSFLPCFNNIPLLHIGYHREADDDRWWDTEACMPWVM